jgi:enoyl-CoA hydratase/carnithine racemase
MSQEEPILVEYRGKLAIITLNVPKKLNALGGEAYYKLARAMYEVAEHDEVFITVLTGKGRFFSAYVINSHLQSCHDIHQLSTLAISKIMDVY